MKQIKMEMTISIDQEANAAYMKFPWLNMVRGTTEPMLTSSNEMVNIDLDKNGRIMWMEFIPASSFFGDIFD